MEKNPLLSPSDIFIEINGIKIAGVKSYQIQILKDTFAVSSFNKNTPIKHVPLNTSFNIKLSKICLKVPSINLMNLTNFNLVIVKPTSYTMFLNCNWTSFLETTSVGSSIIESLSIVSTKKIKYEL